LYSKRIVKELITSLTEEYAARWAPTHLIKTLTNSSLEAMMSMVPPWAIKEWTSFKRAGARELPEALPLIVPGRAVKRSLKGNHKSFNKREKSTTDWY
jgi:hypothetical protein